MKNVFLLSFLLFIVNVTAQEIIVTGTVLDENNVPLPGARILVKDTTNETSTDFDGLFKIKLSTNQDLIVSFVGYHNYLYKIKDSKLQNLKIKMSVDSSVIDMYKWCFPSKKMLMEVENEKKTYSNTTLKWNGTTFQLVR